MCGPGLGRGGWVISQGDPIGVAYEFHSHRHLPIIAVYIRLMLRLPVMLTNDDFFSTGA